jgi:hypothetical protein
MKEVTMVAVTAQLKQNIAAVAFRAFPEMLGSI